MPVSRRLATVFAAVVVTPALVFAPTAVADTTPGNDSTVSSLPTELVDSLGGTKANPLEAVGSIDGNQISTAVTVFTALLDAGVSVGDIITIVMALNSAGVSISDMLAVLSFIADNPAVLNTVLTFIENGWITQIIALIR